MDRWVDDRWIDKQEDGQVNRQSTRWGCVGLTTAESAANIPLKEELVFESAPSPFRWMALWWPRLTP